MPARPVKVEKIDDFTVKFTFAAANALYLENLATPLGQHPTLFPKHYCSQFLPKYNPNIAEEVKKAGVASWTELFRARCGDIEIPSRWGNPDKPTLDPWIVKEPYSGGATRVVMTRNPYFWQVDTEGNQLPYIDEINFGISQDVEVADAERHLGKDRHSGASYQRSREQADALPEHGKGRLPPAVARCLPPRSSARSISTSTHKDPALRKMFADKSFRQALSLGNQPPGIDRHRLFRPERSLPGRAAPGHTLGITKSSRASSPNLIRTRPARCWIKAGYTGRMASGFRLRPDGQKMFFAVDVIPTLYPDLVDALELVKAHWAQIGIEMKVNTIERALYYTRGDDNAHDAAVWPGPGGLDPMLDPRDFFAFHPQGSRYAIPWSLWYTSNGAQRRRTAGKPEETHEALRRRPFHRRSRQARRDYDADLRYRG